MLSMQSKARMPVHLSHRRSLALLALLALVNVAISTVGNIIEVNLTRISYNYVVDVWLNGSTTTPYPVVVDTGNINFLMNQVYNDTQSYIPSNFVCGALVIDGGNVVYYSYPPYACSIDTSMIELGGIYSTVTIDYSESVRVSNPLLHEWNLTRGDIGLGYNYCEEEICPPTPFQSILANSSSLLDSNNSSNSTFGLDFRNSESDIGSIASVESTMQLGGIKPEYKDSIVWLTQPTTQPMYHNFMIENLEFCGAKLFANYSTTWQVMVDTGASCLTLPAEMYDTFEAWFDNTTEISSLAQLPAFTFKLSTGIPTETFYLPLGIFAVNSNAIENSAGALSFNYKGSLDSKKLCILRGDNIEESGIYASSPPTISFGNLALQSLYFGSNFNTFSEGFANKLSTDEIDFYKSYNSNPSCSAQPICVGAQNYHPDTNSCQDPNCKKYFFVHLDEDRHVCAFNPSAVGFGLVFIGFIMFMEIVSYFLEQYSGYTLAERSRRSFGENNSGLGNSFKVDIVTLYAAKFITVAVDLLINLSQRISSGGNRNRRARVPRDEHADMIFRDQPLEI